MKCIVVDDEPFALDLIKSYVEKTPFLELQGTFANPIRALSFLVSNSVDLLFLDINMPELSGLQLLSSLKKRPMVIFTTAYSEYGADSYNYDAVDYLLKPVKYDRFLRAVTKAYEINNKPHSEKISTDQSVTENPAILVKSGAQIHKISPDKILFIEGAGNYMTFHTAEKKILSLLTMKEVLTQLPTEQFVRIHKSYIVSLSHIEMIERHRIEIKGHKIPIGITYREQFLARYKSLS